MEIYALLVQEELEEEISAVLRQPSARQYLSRKDEQKILTIPGHLFIRMLYTAETISFLKSIPGVEGFFLQTHENQDIDEMQYYELSAFEDTRPSRETVEDSSGRSAKISPNQASHTKGYAYSIDLNFDPGDYALLDISDGTKKLRPNTDYIINREICSILPSYLEEKDIGAFTLTFNMSGGFNPAVSLEIKPGNAKVRPSRISYSLGSEITPKISLIQNGRRLLELNDGNSLAPNIHYTVERNTFILQRSYLDHIATYLSGTGEDQISIRFRMDGGTDPVASIRINAADAFIKPNAVSYTKGSDEALSFTLTTSGHRLLALEEDSERLTQNDYTISGETCTIKASYLDSLAEKLQSGGMQSARLIFRMDGGKSPEATIRLRSDEPLLEPVNAIYTKGSGVHIAFTLQPQGKKFVSLHDGTKELAREIDYFLSGNRCTVLSSYFEKKEAEIVKLSFVMDTGMSPVATVQIRNIIQTATAELWPEPDIPAEEKEAPSPAPGLAVTEVLSEPVRERPEERPVTPFAAIPQEDREESLDSFIKDRASASQQTDIFLESEKKPKISIIRKLKEKFVNIRGAFFLLALIMAGILLIILYSDYRALKDIEPEIYYENDEQWNTWKGMDHTVSEGVLSIDRRVYYAPHAMFFVPMDNLPQIDVAIKMNTTIKGFTAGAYSVLTVFTPSGNISVVADKQNRIGIMTGPQGEITYSATGAYTESKAHDLYLFLDEPNREVSVYIDGRRVLNVERDIIAYPLQEVWVGSVWVGGGNDLGVALGHEINSFIVSDNAIILANYTFAENMRQNFRDKTWLWAFPALSALFILAAIIWGILTKKKNKKQANAI